MLQLYSGNQVSFFEIAATLIPLLLFGGVVAERVGPTGLDSGRLMRLGMMVAVVGSYAVIAEVAAIAVVVTGEPNLLAEILTMTFLFGGMIGVVAALVKPWYSALHGKSETRPRARLLAGMAGVVLASAASVALAVTLLGLDRAEEGQFSEARSATITQKTTEEAAVRSRILVLRVATARVRRQATAAQSRGESPVILDSYADEAMTLKRMLVAEKKRDRRLVRVIAALRDQMPEKRAPW